jgi:dienelactone hydrolase
MKRIWRASIAAAIGFTASEASFAQGTEVSFQSFTPILYANALKKQGTALTVSATLFLPPGASAARKFPAMVVLHGSGGITPGRELEYGPKLNAIGVAVLVVDSYGSRGLTRLVPYDQRIARGTAANSLADAFAALSYLATRAEIDSRRIGVMGFSLGAMAARLAADRMFADVLAPRGLRFAAHADFYGPCIIHLRNPRPTGAPLLMLYGDRDESIDVAQCRRIEGTFAANGVKTRLVVFPGAAHGWEASEPVSRQNILNPVACSFILEADGTATDEKSGKPLRTSEDSAAALRQCRREGYLFGSNPAAARAAMQELAAFLRLAFKLR